MSSICQQDIKFYTALTIDKIPYLNTICKSDRLAMKTVAAVLPFRVNNYIIEELIDWENVPNDPIFQLFFPQKEMLTDEQFEKLTWHLTNNSSSRKLLREVVNTIRQQLNPHPAGQAKYNIPTLNNQPIPGIQHKYFETVLVFPAAGQTCHSYCSFCFRWPQFVSMNDHKFSLRDPKLLQEYLLNHKGVTDVLFTGGDPMVMKAHTLTRYIEPLLEPGFEHIQTIRIGTKSVANWPYRYVTDRDADDILRLFEKIVLSGKHLAIMAHYNHWKELSTLIAQKAIQRIRSTGAQIRTQAPLLRRINDSSEVWTRMWQAQVRLGCIPYYLFVERDTGANHYFKVPLAKAITLFQEASKKLSGLGKTVRGPVMSALPGKILINGVSEIHGEEVFVLSFLNGRNPDWCNRPFFARYDSDATWFTDLLPALNETHFFYEKPPFR